MNKWVIVPKCFTVEAETISQARIEGLKIIKTRKIEIEEIFNEG